MILYHYHAAPAVQQRVLAEYVCVRVCERVYVTTCFVWLCLFVCLFLAGQALVLCSGGVDLHEAILAVRRARLIQKVIHTPHVQL